MPEFDTELVFSHRDYPTKKGNLSKKALLVVLSALVVVGVVFFTLRYMRRQGDTPKHASPATASEAVSTAPASAPTSAPAADTTSVPKTTAPKATAASGNKTAQQKLEAYLRQSDLTENLTAGAGVLSDVSFTSATVEDNIITARYMVHSDSQNEENSEFFESFDGSEICAVLEEDVAVMKQKSGVSNAQIAVDIVDINGKTVYSGFVD